MVVFASELVARGPVKRCANHISEDRQAGTVLFCCYGYCCIDVLLCF